MVNGLTALRNFSRHIHSLEVKRTTTLSEEPAFDQESMEKYLVALFAEQFASREPKLTCEELVPFRHMASRWRELMCHYDLVHAYATDPIYPLMAGKKYVAFEHGTIRNIPFEDTTQGRFCALSYRNASSVVITNADNMASAERLNVPNYGFVPHPISEARVTDFSAGKKRRKELEKVTGGSFFIFHPARQHWSSERHPDWEKGNDILLQGFAAFVKRHCEKAVLIMVEWGKMVDESKGLIRSLEIENNVLWISPVSHPVMISYVQASDIIADQFFLGAFGSTVPKAMACSRPVMLYLDEELHKPCFGSLPPVLNVKTPADVLESLREVFEDQDRIEQLREASRNWYLKEHSNVVIRRKLSAVYESVCATD